MYHIYIYIYTDQQYLCTSTPSSVHLVCLFFFFASLASSTTSISSGGVPPASHVIEVPPKRSKVNGLGFSIVHLAEGLLQLDRVRG